MTVEIIAQLVMSIVRYRFYAAVYNKGGREDVVEIVKVDKGSSISLKK